jgi:DNA-binding SARP family transcriptional activator
LLPRWVGSFLGLTALTVGIPAVLIVFHVVPPLAQLGHVVTRPALAAHYFESALTDSAVAKSAAAAAWLIWVWLAFCVVAEVVAAIAGRPPLRLPASRHIQALVSGLVGASMTVIPVGRVLPMRLAMTPAAVGQTAGLRAAVQNTAITTTAAPVPKYPSDGGDLALMSDDQVPVTSMAGPVYVVEPGDTLWSIADNQLGSPLQWPAIAKLNYGRPQADGGELTDAHWIFPGWTLLLPSTPSRPSIPVTPATTTPTAPTTLQDTAPTPAASGLSVAVTEPVPASGEMWPLSTPLDFDSSVSGNGKEEKSVGQLVGSRSEKAEYDAGVPGPEGRGRSPVPVGAISYGILGAGVIGLLERLRRAQRRHRPVGLRIALPESDLAVLEQRLRSQSDPAGLDIIDVGLRALVVYSRRAGRMPPPVTFVRLGEHVLEVALDTAVADEPPWPFTAHLNGDRWYLRRDVPEIQTIRDDPEVMVGDAPFPALVTIGRDEFGVVLVDLEHAASLDISGLASEVLTSVAVETATAKWADQVDLILVGFDQELEVLERVTYGSTIAEVTAKVQRRVRERTALLNSVGCRANWEIRWAEGGDAWDLCVVMCAPAAVEADRQGAAELVRLAGSGGMGLAVVLGSPVDARWHLHEMAGRIEVESKGRVTSTVTAQNVDGNLSTGVASLVKVASELDGVRPDEPPYDEIVTAVPETGPRTEGPFGESGTWALAPSDNSADGLAGAVAAKEPDREFEVEVRILGPVEIAGASREFTRAWAIELIVYLSMHRNGASSEQWATALWPDRVMAAASLHSTASAARRSLGVSRAGEDHLPRAHGRLALGPTVGSDWNHFVELAGRPAPESWCEALELIRGRPFEGLRAPDWVLLEGIAANVEAVIVDLAGRYAEHCLSLGDPNGAQWAARQGLRASAYDERLYRVLMRAAEAAGHPAGVESVMAELVHLVAEDVEPYDAVHPETLDLYRVLSRRSAPFAGH